MSTFENRPNSALLFVDMQNGVIEGVYKRDAVVANIGSLIGKARRERVPIIRVQHSDGQQARQDALYAYPEKSSRRFMD